MNILNKLSIRNLKLNKKRTISTIIGISLSVALICAVATMCISFRETLIQGTINVTGYWHLLINNVKDKDIEELKQNRDIKDIYAIQEIGYSLFDSIENEHKPYLEIFSMNEQNFNNLKFRLINGRFPKNENEIIISKHLITNGGADLKIGDKIKLDIGSRVTLEDEESLYSCNPYHLNNEKLVNTQKREFTIVGIIERPNYIFEEYSGPGYTAITTNIKGNINNVFISFNKPKEYQQSIVEITGASSFVNIGNEDNLKYSSSSLMLNNDLLRYEAMAMGESSINMLYSVVGVVIFIIMFTSIFCIRNSFAISTTEKIKMYGMLASVGTTKKQIRKNVIFEAMILTLIGIPLGIIVGLLAVVILFKIVNALVGSWIFGDYINGFVLKISFLPILVSIILSIITIYLSVISSARKASKMSPIESLRSSNEIKIKSKKLKTPKIIKKLFGMGGVIAYKNLKRSKKKYRTTVISIATSIFIFITMSVFLKNMTITITTSNFYKDLNYNFNIYANDSTGISEEDAKTILKLENIDESFRVYGITESLILNDTSKFEDIPKEYKQIEERYGVNQRYMQLIALDDTSFAKYAKKIGANYNKIKSKAILCDNEQVTDENGKIKEFRLYNYKVGENIGGKFTDYITNNIKDFNVEIGKITKQMPYGSEQTFYDGGALIINEGQYKDLGLVLQEILINSKNTDQLEKDINSLNFKNYRIANIATFAKQQKSMNIVVHIFLYGFISVITIIGVTNVFNTITSNIELRQKEFAMLKSIGMTKKEFNKMINLETIFYSTKSLIYGIILGLIGTFALYKAFSVKFDAGMYLPIKPIIISTLAVFILVFIIMKYSVNKVNKQNTIETIRKENI